MKFKDNVVPEDVQGMFNEIIRMKDDDEIVKACLTPKNIKTPLEAFIMTSYTALRQREMWRDAFEDLDVDIEE